MNPSANSNAEQRKKTIVIVGSASVVMLSILPALLAGEMSGGGNAIWNALGVFLLLIGLCGALASAFLFYRYEAGKAPDCSMLTRGSCLMGLDGMDSIIMEAEIIAYLKSRGINNVSAGDLAGVIMAAKNKAKQAP